MESDCRAVPEEVVAATGGDLNREAVPEQSVETPVGEAPEADGDEEKGGSGKRARSALDPEAETQLAALESQEDGQGSTTSASKDRRTRRNSSE